MRLHCRSATTQRRSCWSPTLCTVWHLPTCRILHPNAYSPSPALTVPKPLRGDVTREHPSGGSSEPLGNQRPRVWTTDAHLHPWKHSTTGWEGKYQGPRKEAQLIVDLRRKSEPDRLRRNKYSLRDEGWEQSRITSNHRSLPDQRTETEVTSIKKKKTNLNICHPWFQFKLRLGCDFRV